MDELHDILREFLVESNENLDQLDRDLVILERDPGNRAVLAGIFRTLHTIKGTCGFFGFQHLGALTHAAENLLSQLRDGKVVVTPAVTSVLLALVDAIRRTLAAIEQTGQEPNDNHARVIDQLNRLHAGPTVARAPKPEAQAEVPPPETSGSKIDLDVGDPTDARPGVSEGSIRVDVVLLDRLMNLVGELVLARNQILQCLSHQADPTILSTTQRLDLITTELQEGVMKTRMQPIAKVWNKLPRVVRDLSLDCGKQVRLTVQGKETELDKSIIESIKDPLTHLVRNALDHGIETPARRRQLGKPPEGHLLLRAFHEGGQVNIEIADDGAGIDPQRLQHKAIERGLITREQGARMSDRELLHLIFSPGFSTADKVTNVSGRGVGMDVVKTSIEKISGTVDVQSRPGQGTTVRIKIPLTLAIIPALLVSTGGACYAIPQVSLLELVRLEGELAKSGIEYIHGAPVYRLRGNLLPLVYLNRELNVDPKPADSDVGAVNVVILQADHRPFGLVVDGINDTEEIVVKPLGKLLKGIPLFAGATILGDGRVALILDVLGLAQSASVVTEVQERALTAPPDRAGEAASGSQTLLLVGVGKDRQLAIPLSQVARLEDIPRAAVEYAEGREAIQYRGRILPLFHLGDRAHRDVTGSEKEPSMQVVVLNEQGRSVGVVVDRILDIVEARIDSGCRQRGSAIIQQRVTDLVDVRAILEKGCEP